MASVFSVAAGAATARPTPGRLSVIDPIIQDAIRTGQVPGAVVLVWHNGQAYRKASGYRALEPRRELMTEDTIFDVASLTKVVATTTSVMQLVEQGSIRLNDRVTQFIPEFGKNGKSDITIRQLLTHTSGLAPDLPLEVEFNGSDEAIRRAIELPPGAPPGQRFIYSDINFFVL